jgi:HSP20 family protein
LEDEMGRLFGVPARWPQEGLLEGAWCPSVDVYQTDDRVMVNADVPGVPKEEIDISIDDGVLTIKGQKKKESEVKEEDFRRVERCYGRFERSFRLPTTVDAENVQATYNDGVLEIALPKKPEAKARQITVNVK